MAELSCPVCVSPLDEAGSTFRCVLCEGVWLAADVLVPILEQRASTLVDLPWQPRVDKPRPCAECGAQMQTVNLGTVALDRCEPHGVWFDANELTALLKQVKQFKTHEDTASHNVPHARTHEAHREGLMRRLAKLFTVS